jgi:DNA-binding SARP family transcriptional activator/Tfp pilus assembly protein PilF
MDRRWGCAVRFRLLGPLAVDDIAGDGAVPPGARLRVLLATLVLHANTPIPRDALAETVWDANPPPGADASLRSYVLRLRRALGPEAGARIEYHDPGYLIRLTRSEVDVLEFDALARKTAQAVHAASWEEAAALGARALALWRGQPLLDVPSRILRNEFVPRLEQLFVQLREDCVEADLRLGRYDRLVPQLRELTTAYPLRERFHTQLMLALAHGGRRAEALEVYQRARQTLVDELGVEPGPELRDLHERILTGGLDPGAATNAAADLAPTPAPQEAATRPSVPRQLPAAVRLFTGRQTELDELARLPGGNGAFSGTVVISAIDGMAGIGKTTLAVHAAHRLAEWFPDGQLFIDLHGYTKGYRPRSPAEALEAFLHALGVPAQQVPEDVDQRAALYRQRLAGTKTLILLDNAVDEAQLRPLLPASPGCLVLVTSRRRLKGLDEAHSLSLDLLPAQDAVVLLRAVVGPDRIGADDPLLGEIARLCGRLPLAIRIAGALLRHRPAWTLEHLASLLRDQHQRVSVFRDGERDLASIFDLSYSGLDEQHQRVLRRLGMVPGPDSDAYAAAALLECDPTTATWLLEDLVDHNLLIEYAPGRYRLHDLMRAHARALATSDPEADRDAALDRLLHYYAHTAQSASVPIARYPRPAPHGPAPAYAPDVTDPEAARAWLRGELDNLEAAQAYARAAALHEHTLALAAGLAETLRIDGHFTRALDLHQAAAETAERHGHPVAHADALLELGRVRRMTGDPAGAGEALSRALEIYRATGNHSGEATTLTEQARLLRLSGETAAAADALTEALEICRATGNHGGEANALTELGNVPGPTGDLIGAADALDQALGIYHAIGHRSGEADVLLALGRIRQYLGDLASATDLQTRALGMYRAIGHRQGEAYALTELGNLRGQAGDMVGAADALSQALEIHRAIGHRSGEAGALVELGTIWSRTGDPVKAAEALSQALEIYRATGDLNNEAWALNPYAATIAAAGDTRRAFALYRQSLAMNREMNKTDDEAIALEGLAECHLSIGEIETAATHLREALEIFQRLGMAPDAQRVQNRLEALAAEE